jgi:hypothetical protein
MDPVKTIHIGLVVLTGFVLVQRFRSLRRNPLPAVRALFLIYQGWDDVHHVA